MAKVDWITWKTNPEEIINPEKVLRQIQENYQKYNSYMNPLVYEQIKYEINKGGLGKESLDIMGITPANEMALGIIDKIDEIKNVFDNLQEEIMDAVTEQKSIEKAQLIKAIEEKKANECQLLDSVINDEAVRNHITDIGGSIEDVIYLLNYRINKLNERLEIAKSL